MFGIDFDGDGKDTLFDDLIFMEMVSEEENENSGDDGDCSDEF